MVRNTGNSQCTNLDRPSTLRCVTTGLSACIVRSRGDINK